MNINYFLTVLLFSFTGSLLPSEDFENQAPLLGSAVAAAAEEAVEGAGLSKIDLFI